tara:strand:- start:40688 stop:40978 length:291 start_codon:yes stop_codon:yes gene_type:complete
LTLRDFILDFNDQISQTIKYGMTCFVFKKRHFCYLATDKKTNNPYILIVEGRNIEHPLLVQGDRKRMKVLPINPMEDIPISAINEIFTKALQFYTN